ncbi:bifunctional DNA primase/polymerase [Longispora sp. NPDC051575]|uniref:bifunctional DNA primase/polymerase n=1 Tax=Longispora sp. NPDC051575 TaxID=3154943 RepID=UPI0034231CE5
MGLVADAAVGYAAAGIPVVPLHTPEQGVCSCRTGPGCPSPGKHPRLRHGLRDASADPGQVAAWWRRWPDANVGLVTGSVLDVCDADTGAGLATVLDVLDVIRPDGPVVRTGQGWHLWFAPSGLPSRVGFVLNVDWRGQGGLVVAPPSVHATGARYTFTQPFRHGLPLPEPPDRLRELVLHRPAAQVDVWTPAVSGIGDVDAYGLAALDGEVRRVRDAPRPLYRDGRRVRAGGRNDALNIAAFKLGQLSERTGLDRHVVWPALTDAARAAGLGQAEAGRTIASGWRAGLRHPRRSGP